MVSNLIIWSILMVISYPISKYLLMKGFTLDITMPGNKKRYKKLGYGFRIPLVNVLVTFIYLCIMLHKFERV